MTPRRHGRTLAFGAGIGAGALIARRRRLPGKRFNLSGLALKGIRRIKQSPRGYKVLDKVMGSKTFRRLVLRMI